jgi:hypothetical protein
MSHTLLQLILGSQNPFHIPQEAIRHVNVLLPHGGEKICSALDSLASAVLNDRTITFDPQFSEDDMHHIHELLCYRVQWVRIWFQLLGMYVLLDATHSLPMV